MVTLLQFETLKQLHQRKEPRNKGNQALAAELLLSTITSQGMGTSQELLSFLLYTCALVSESWSYMILNRLS